MAVPGLDHLIPQVGDEAADAVDLTRAPGGRLLRDVGGNTEAGVREELGRDGK
jgi:hypothetical protein